MFDVHPVAQSISPRDDIHLEVQENKECQVSDEPMENLELHDDVAALPDKNSTAVTANTNCTLEEVGQSPFAEGSITIPKVYPSIDLVQEAVNSAGNIQIVNEQNGENLMHLELPNEVTNQTVMAQFVDNMNLPVGIDLTCTTQAGNIVSDSAPVILQTQNSDIDPASSTVLTFPTVSTYDVQTVSSDVAGQNNVQYSFVINAPISWDTPLFSGPSVVPSLSACNLLSQPVIASVPPTVVQNVAQYETVVQAQKIPIANRSCKGRSK